MLNNKDIEDDAKEISKAFGALRGWTKHEVN